METITRKRGPRGRNRESIDLDDLLDDSNFLDEAQEMETPGEDANQHNAAGLHPKTPPKPTKPPSSYKPPVVLPGRQKVITSNTRDLIDFLSEGPPDPVEKTPPRRSASSPSLRKVASNSNISSTTNSSTSSRFKAFVSRIIPGHARRNSIDRSNTPTLIQSANASVRSSVEHDNQNPRRRLLSTPKLGAFYPGNEGTITTTITPEVARPTSPTPNILSTGASTTRSPSTLSLRVRAGSRSGSIPRISSPTPVSPSQQVPRTTILPPVPMLDNLNLGGLRNQHPPISSDTYAFPPSNGVLSMSTMGRANTITRKAAPVYVEEHPTAPTPPSAISPIGSPRAPSQASNLPQHQRDPSTTTVSSATGINALPRARGRSSTDTITTRTDKSSLTPAEMVAEIVRAGARSPTHGGSSSISAGPHQLHTPVSPAPLSSSPATSVIDIRNPNPPPSTTSASATPAVPPLPPIPTPSPSKKPTDISTAKPRSSEPSSSAASPSSENSLITPPRTPRAAASSVNFLVHNNQGIQTDVEPVPEPNPIPVPVRVDTSVEALPPPPPENKDTSIQTDEVPVKPVEPVAPVEKQEVLFLGTDEREKLRQRMREATTVEECRVFMDVLLARLAAGYSIPTPSSTETKPATEDGEREAKVDAKDESESPSSQLEQDRELDLVALLLDDASFTAITAEVDTPTAATPTQVEQVVPAPDIVVATVTGKNVLLPPALTLDNVNNHTDEDEALPRHSTSSVCSTEAEVTSTRPLSPSGAKTSPPRLPRIPRSPRGPNGLREKRVLPTYVPPSTASSLSVTAAETPISSPRASEEIATA